MSSELGKKIRYAAAERGFSQLEIARKMGAGQKTISNWMSGLIIPKPHKLRLLATILGVDYESIANNSQSAADFIKSETEKKSKYITSLDFKNKLPALEEIRQTEFNDEYKAILQAVSKLDTKSIMSLATDLIHQGYPFTARDFLFLIPQEKDKNKQSLPEDLKRK